MTIYIVFWIIILLMVFFELKFDVVVCEKVRFKSKKISFFVIYIFSILVGIFRNEFLGVDVLNYRSHFYSLRQVGLLDSLKYGDSDWGFFLFSKIISLFTEEYNTYKAVLYIITFTIVAVIIYKQSRYPAISFMVYFGLGFWGYNFCILRQALAISICFWGFKFAKDRQLIRFIICVIVATLIHSTAIIFIIIYPIINTKINGISMTKRFALMIIAYVFGKLGLPFVYHFFHTDYSTFIIQNQGMAKLIMLLCIIMFIQLLIVNIPFSKKEEYDAAFISVYTQIVSLFFSLFTRMTQYFILFLVLVVPEVCEKKKNTLVNLIFVFIFTIMYFLMLDGMSIVPYVSIF